MTEAEKIIEILSKANVVDIYWSHPIEKREDAKVTIDIWLSTIPGMSIIIAVFYGSTEFHDNGHTADYIEFGLDIRESGLLHNHQRNPSVVLSAMHRDKSIDQFKDFIYNLIITESSL